MTDAIIYYGAPVSSSSQTVSEALRLRGINLLRSTVRDAAPDGFTLVSSPTYDIYKENLHIAMEVFRLGTPLPFNDDNRFIKFSHKTNLEGFNKLPIVWDYKGIEPAMDATAKDAMMNRFDPAEISIHDRPAYVATLNLQQLTALIKTSTNRTTPTIANTINISAALALTKIQRLANAFLNVHQYSLVSTGTTQEKVYKDLFNMTERPGKTSSSVCIKGDWFSDH